MKCYKISFDAPAAGEYVRCCRFVIAPNMTEALRAFDEYEKELYSDMRPWVNEAAVIEDLGTAIVCTASE